MSHPIVVNKNHSHYFTKIVTQPILLMFIFFFFFNDTATTEIYTLSLHDALPISARAGRRPADAGATLSASLQPRAGARSEEHTSELQSHLNLVCRLLLEKKKIPNSLTQKY